MSTLVTQICFISQDCEQTTQLLIEAGANVNDAKNDGLNTPLHALALSLFGMMKIFPGKKLSHFIHFNIYLITGTHPNIVEILIDHGANVKAVNKQGYSPLMLSLLVGKNLFY